MKIRLTYTQSQLDVFFPRIGSKYTIVPKGRRWGATKGAANACIEWCCDGLPILWGDTINSNIDRYVQRYIEPELIKYHLPYNYNAQKKQLQLFKGFIDFRSADKPENWEGFGYKKIILNEAGIILKNESLYTNTVLPMLMDYSDSELFAIGTPKGKTHKGRTHRFFKLFQLAQNDKNYRYFQFSSYDNPLLPKESISELEAEINKMNPEMVRQEIYGEFIDGAGGVLWDEVIIERNRVEEYPKLNRVIIAIDPAVTANKNSDETGIIVMGIKNGIVYVIDDISGRYTPMQWGMVVAGAIKKYDVDCVVGEVNQGGDMVENIIRQYNRNIRYRGVRATKGKFIRAEPIYSLYESGKVKHVGVFSKLEAQMISFGSESSSPDRVDALVWGVTELLINDAPFYVM